MPHMFTIPWISEMPMLKAFPQMTSLTPLFFPSRYLMSLQG